MQFSGTEEIAAPREMVWTFLMDPDRVGGCGPGVQSIEVVDEDHFNARAKVGVGFITATFNVHMTFLERVELEKARIEARGQAPGSAVDAVGEMNLSPGANGGTRMEWSANVNISGTLASVGARLIEGTANKLIAQTFGCIRTRLETQAQEEGAAVPTKAARVVAPVATPEPVPAAAPAAAHATHAAGSPAAPASAHAAPAQVAAEGRPAAPHGAPPVAAQATSAAPRRTAPIRYLSQPVGPLSTNLYLFADPDTGDAIAIDTARPSLSWLAAQVEARAWHLRLIVSTHGHWDHIGDNAAIQAWSAERARADGRGHGRADIAVHALDRSRLVSPQPMFAPFDIPPSTPTVELGDGDRVSVGPVEFEVLHTPGHTPGSICLLSRRGNLLISGDTLFAGGWGRVDLPGGSATDMVASIRRLHELPDEVRVFPGHGPTTTIGRERAWMDVVVDQGRLFA